MPRASAGRPIFDDVEVCEIRSPGIAQHGQRFPSTAVSHWASIPNTGEQVKITYAERFSRQYQQFKAQQAQTKSGTPLEFAPFLTEAAAPSCARSTSTPSRQLAAVDGRS
jgi:hypothetical protein